MENIPKITKSEFEDFTRRCRYLYYIRTKKNKLVPYNPNGAQEYLNQVRQEEFERNKKIKGVEQCKLILLKSRQVGGTTDTAMFNLDIMLNLKMAYGLILAHDGDTTPIIYEKYRLAYHNLPDAIQIVKDDGTEILNSEGNPLIVPIKPETEAFSGYQLKFSDMTQSRVLVRTAGGGANVSRGDTLNFCHLSEGAYYDYFDDVLISINQTMSDESFAYSVIESTANGVSGKGEGFYKFWKTSVKEWKNFKNGTTDTFEGYRPIFIPWYKLKEYRKPLVNGQLINIDNINWHHSENKEDFLKMEEKLVEEVFDDKQEGLEAINWYRWCIKENCKFDINEAKREYPTTPEQAFITSDKCFFDTPSLFVVKETFETEGEKEFQKGYINDNYQFVEQKYGELKIWEHPQKLYKNRYVVSVDPSEGREDGDYSVIMVFDRLEEKFVAKWYGSLKEDLIADELLKIAYYYNKALIIPERNLSTVMTLIEPYGMMPYTGELYYQALSSGRTEYGFYTLNNRKDLLMQYNAWLRGNYDKIPDDESLDEHVTFVKQVQRGRPKYEASEGNHDDQVIAMALCIEGHYWWDREIYKTDEEESDIEQIFQKPKRRRPIKVSNLGGKDSNYPSRKSFKGNVKISNLGK